MSKHVSKEVRIGIFEGKKAEYNMAILETLFKHGPLTTWEIAKKIQQTKNPVQNRESNFYRTQKIYGVIARKGGRLDSLHKNEHILLRDGKWELNFPKADAILIKKPEIISEFHQHYLTTPAIKKDVRKKSKRAMINVNLSNADIKKLHMDIAAKMKTLVEEGIDLDRISNKNLSLLVIANVTLVDIIESLAEVGKKLQGSKKILKILQIDR